LYMRGLNKGILPRCVPISSPPFREKYLLQHYPFEFQNQF
jgi:hypothetical protein